MAKTNGTLIGLLAGVAAGLMVVAAMRSVTAAMPMLLATPVPIYIAALGWGTVPGFLAAITGTAVALIGGKNVVIFAALLMFFPAAWAGHLANLAQTGEDGKSLVWYPLGDILMRLAGAIALGFVIAGFALDIDMAGIEEGMTALLRELISASDEPVSETGIARSAQLYAALLPFVMPAMWVFMHVAIFGVSASLVRLSGKSVRPKDDIPATANLPATSIAWLAAGIAGMVLFESPLYEVAAVVFGTGFAAFALTGLAAFHFTTRGRPGRGLLLFSTYLLIFLFSIPLLLFAIWGVVRAFRGVRSPPTSWPPGTGGPPSTI